MADLPKDDAFGMLGFIILSSFYAPGQGSIVHQGRYHLR
jgi:hypothetical protein